MPLVENLVSKLYTQGVNAYKTHSINDKEIILQIDDLKPCYTNGDLVKGQVIIDFHEDITVTGIFVKLKCDIGTRVFFDERTKNAQHLGACTKCISCHSRKKTKSVLSISDEDKIRKDRLRVSASRSQVYRQDIRVFPTEDLMQNMAKSYTIAAGRHIYDFTVRFPDSCNQTLPPTFSQGSFNDNAYFYCEHSIKVTVKKASSFASDPRLEKTIAVTPYFDERAFESSPLATISDIFDLNKYTRIDVQALVPEHGLPQIPYHLPIQLAVRSHSVPIIVKNLCVSLNRRTRWNSRDIRRQKHSMEDEKSIIIGVVPINQSGTTFDLSDSFQNLMITGDAIPSFYHDLLEVSYELVIGITLSLDGDTYSSCEFQVIELHGPVEVLPAALPPSLSSVYSKPPTETPTCPPPPVVFDSKAEMEYVNDLKSGQTKRPYLPAYQE